MKMKTKLKMRFFSSPPPPPPPPSSSSRHSVNPYSPKELAEIRLKNELRRNLHPSTAYVGFKQVADRDLFRFIGTIIGPSDTPYEGGVFSLSIKIPHTYPMTPPKITFLTKVFHPNITEDGIIHVDVLGDNWLPTLTIEKMLLSICSFLDDPNPEDPLNPICCLYRNHRETYIKKAREWTKKYAMSY